MYTIIHTHPHTHTLGFQNCVCKSVSCVANSIMTVFKEDIRQDEQHRDDIRHDEQQIRNTQH